MSSNKTENELTTSAAASMNDEPNSEQPTKGLQSVSVLDFLYHDVRRVASFLAQFHELGVLSQVKATEGVTSASSTKTGVLGEARVPGFARGQVGFDTTTTDEERDSQERTYDPLWTNARTLLDYLDEQGMVRRDLASAQMGQFVLVSGQILLLDLKMLRGAWEKQPIQKMIRAGAQGVQSDGNRAQRRAAAAGTRNKTAGPDEIEGAISLLSILPHSIQARMVAENVNVWCTLDEGSIVGQSGDLVLKHGSLIGGEWFMLGVLDAEPYDPGFRNEEGEDEAQLLGRIAGTALGQMAAALAPAARVMMGRPPFAYGVTPLLIFRDVNGGAEIEEPPISGEA